MSVITKLKGAPRWSFWAAGGIAGGALLIHAFRNRATAADPAPEETPADAAYQYGAGGATGVIVPPVILPAEDSSGDAAGMFGYIADAFGGIVGTVDSIYAGVYGPIQGQNADLLSAVLGMAASAGPAPVNAAENPTPLAQATAIAQPAPVLVSTSGQPTTTETCASKYPKYPKWNAKNGAPSGKSCYRNECVNGKPRHTYKDGHFVVMAGSC